MTTVKNIFDYIQSLNPSTLTISSIGTFTSSLSEQIANDTLGEVINHLPAGTLAYKIADTTNLGRFSIKQLWVIAYELVKNEEFCSIVSNFYAEIERKENFKKAVKKAKKNGTIGILPLAR